LPKGKGKSIVTKKQPTKQGKKEVVIKRSVVIERAKAIVRAPVLKTGSNSIGSTSGGTTEWSMDGNGIVIKRKEYGFLVNLNTPVLSAGNLYLYPVRLSPTSTLFSGWLAGIAPFFEMYRFLDIKVHFVTQITEFACTGSNYLAFDPDVQDIDENINSVGIQYLMDLTSSAFGKSSSSRTITIPRNAFQQDWYFTSPGATATHNDASRLENCGVIWVAFDQANSASTNKYPGSITVEYTIGLKLPESRILAQNQWLGGRKTQATATTVPIVDFVGSSLPSWAAPSYNATNGGINVEMDQGFYIMDFFAVNSASVLTLSALSGAITYLLLAGTNSITNTAQTYLISAATRGITNFIIAASTYATSFRVAATSYLVLPTLVAEYGHNWDDVRKKLQLPQIPIAKQKLSAFGYEKPVRSLMNFIPEVESSDEDECFVMKKNLVPDCQKPDYASQSSQLKDLE
jgi:hypothetical protein